MNEFIIAKHQIGTQMMEKSDDSKEILRITSAAQEVSGKLASLLAYDHSTNDSVYAIKQRVKSAESFQRKLQQKRELDQKLTYSPFSVTDVIGIRFITLFRDELTNIAGNILDYIAGGVSPFRKHSIEEFIFYKSDRSVEPIVRRVRHQILDKLGEDLVRDIFRVSEKGSGYSSIHIVTRLESGFENGTSEKDAAYYLPLEIQIRTVFEDAWGEIDHKYLYKVHESGAVATRSRNYFVQKHIENLKGLTDCCAQYANLIHQEATRSAELLATPSPQSLADSDEAVTKIIESNGVEEDILKSVMSARRGFRSAKKQLEDGRTDSATQTLLDVACALKKSRKTKFGKECPSEQDSDRTAYFYLTMEEALCRYSTDSRSEVEEAIELYLRVKTCVGANPLMHYRLGHAYDSLGAYDEALESLEEANRLIEHSSSDGGTTPNDPTNYQTWGIDTARDRLPISIGYTLWNSARSAGDPGLRAQRLREAYQATLPALDDPAPEGVRDFAINNALFFAVDARSLPEEFTPDWAHSDVVNSLLSKIIKRSPPPSEDTDCSRLDTIMVACSQVGEHQRAEVYADRIVELLVDRAGSGGLSRSFSEILTRAADQLRRGKSRG